MYLPRTIERSVCEAAKRFMVILVVAARIGRLLNMAEMVVAN